MQRPSFRNCMYQVILVYRRKALIHIQDVKRLAMGHKLNIPNRLKMLKSSPSLLGASAYDKFMNN
jgi:hypothetical protein